MVLCLRQFRKIPQASMNGQLTFCSSGEYSFAKMRKVRHKATFQKFLCPKLELYPNFGILPYRAIFKMLNRIPYLIVADQFTVFSSFA